MSNWDRMDKTVWKNSEVMNEFEKLMLKTLVILDGKISEAQVQDISKKLDTINKSVETTAKGVGEFLDLAKNLAEDEVSDKEEAPQEPTEEEQKEAKAKLLEELNDLASKAGYAGDYKLAYQIERAIDSIIFEE